MIFEMLLDVIIGFWGVCMDYLQTVGGYFGIPLMSLAVVGLIIHWFLKILPSLGRGSGGGKGGDGE